MKRMHKISNHKKQPLYLLFVDLTSATAVLYYFTVLLYLGAMRTMFFFKLDIHSLQRATTILNAVFTNYGLCINVSKTETIILNHMFLEDEYPDTIISLRNVPLLNFSFNNLAHISPKTNLTRETLNLITVSRWHTQNLLPWPTSFKTFRFTLTLSCIL